MTKKNALITGGCGFIGSNLAHSLVSEGWKVDIVDDMSNGHIDFLDGLDIRIVPGDMMCMYEQDNEHNRPDERTLVIQSDFVHDSVLKRIREHRYDVIFHAAANPRVSYSVERPVETHETNVHKTVGLFYVAAKSKTPVVFSSSSAVYGNCESFPTAEGEPKSPESPYGLHKLMCEKHAEMFAKTMDLRIVCLRYFNVYGPRQLGDSPYSTAVSSWCDKIYRDMPLRSDGDGDQSRDMIYVGDVVNANILAADFVISKRTPSVYFHAMNVCTGTSVTNNEIIHLFKQRFENIAVDHAPSRPGDVRKTHGEGHTAKFTLNFEPATSLEEGLRQTWHWWNFKNWRESGP